MPLSSYLPSNNKPLIGRSFILLVIFCLQVFFLPFVSGSLLIPFDLAIAIFASMYVRKDIYWTPVFVHTALQDLTGLSGIPTAFFTTCVLYGACRLLTLHVFNSRGRSAQIIGGSILLSIKWIVQGSVWWIWGMMQGREASAQWNIKPFITQLLFFLLISFLLAKIGRKRPWLFL